MAVWTTTKPTDSTIASLFAAHLVWLKQQISDRMDDLVNSWSQDPDAGSIAIKDDSIVAQYINDDIIKTDGGLAISAGNISVLYDEDSIEFDSSLQLIADEEWFLGNYYNNELSSGSQSIGSGATWVVPAGFWMFATDNTNDYKLKIELYVSGSWRRANAHHGWFFSLWSDGTNMRIYNWHSSAITVYYLGSPGA